MIRHTSLPIAVLLAVPIGDSVTADETQQESAKDTAGHFAEVNGIKMYYEIHGEGEPLVLLHGFGDSAEGWESVRAE